MSFGNCSILVFCYLILTGIRSQTEWRIVFAIMRGSLVQPAASRLSFDLLMSICEDGPGQNVYFDNFEGIMVLLDEFATAAGAVVEAVGYNDRRKGAETPQYANFSATVALSSLPFAVI